MMVQNLLSQQKSELLGYFTFNTLLVLGIMMVQHNLQHQKSELLGYFTQHHSTCTWDNDGTAQPAAPEKVNCWDTFTFNILLVLGIMMVPHNLQHQKKSELLGYFTFNTSTCTWDNDGTAQPAAPEKVNCWDTLLSTILLVRGIMMERLPQPTKANCWDILLSTIQLVLGIMMEPHNLQHQKK
jgi:putative Mn2+ efflux pump MntP